MPIVQPVGGLPDDLQGDIVTTTQRWFGLGLMLLLGGCGGKGCDILAKARNLICTAAPITLLGIMFSKFQKFQHCVPVDHLTHPYLLR